MMCLCLFREGFQVLKTPKNPYFIRCVYMKNSRVLDPGFMYYAASMMIFFFFHEIRRCYDCQEIEILTDML